MYHHLLQSAIGQGGQQGGVQQSGQAFSEGSQQQWAGLHLQAVHLQQQQQHHHQQQHQHQQQQQALYGLPQAVYSLPQMSHHAGLTGQQQALAQAYIMPGSTLTMAGGSGGVGLAGQQQQQLGGRRPPHSAGQQGPHPYSQQQQQQLQHPYSQQQYPTQIQQHLMQFQQQQQQRQQLSQQQPQQHQHQHHQHMRQQQQQQQLQLQQQQQPAGLAGGPGPGLHSREQAYPQQHQQHAGMQSMHPAMRGAAAIAAAAAGSSSSSTSYLVGGGGNAAGPPTVNAAGTFAAGGGGKPSAGPPSAVGPSARPSAAVTAGGGPGGDASASAAGTAGGTGSGGPSPSAAAAAGPPMKALIDWRATFASSLQPFAVLPEGHPGKGTEGLSELRLGALEVLVAETPEAANVAVEAMRARMWDGIVAMDTIAKPEPDDPIALLQLSAAGLVVVVRPAACGGLPAAFRTAIVEDTDIEIVVPSWTSNDENNFEESFGLQTFWCQITELPKVAKSCGHSKTGVKALVQAVLEPSAPMPKSKKLAANDWSAPTLPPEHIKQAILDVACIEHVFRCLEGRF